MFFKDSSDFVYKTLSDITLKGGPIGSSLPSGVMASTQAVNVNFINSLILGISLFILLTFLLFPNPLLNIIFETLASSLF